MPKYDYDVITVGGGLGGAALAKVLAKHGLRVLVVERERRPSSQCARLSDCMPRQDDGLISCVGRVIRL
jgi:flavin-dependent dehydrogenase